MIQTCTFEIGRNINKMRCRLPAAAWVHSDMAPRKLHNSKYATAWVESNQEVQILKQSTYPSMISESDLNGRLLSRRIHIDYNDSLLLYV